METKRCSKCKQEKLISDFSFRNLQKGILETRCKECKRQYVRQHYKDNSLPYKQRAKAFSKKQRLILRDYIWDYLQEHPCIDCGENNPIVLQFDHLRDKKYTISGIPSYGLSLETLKSEIVKCEVRCANCHMKKTAKQLGWWSDKLA